MVEMRREPIAWCEIGHLIHSEPTFELMVMNRPVASVIMGWPICP